MQFAENQGVPGEISYLCTSTHIRYGTTATEAIAKVHSMRNMFDTSDFRHFIPVKSTHFSAGAKLP